MKFCLVKDQRVRLPDSTSKEDGASVTKFTCIANIIPTGYPSHFSQIDCDKLRNIIEGEDEQANKSTLSPPVLVPELKREPGSFIADDDPVDWNLLVTIGMKECAEHQRVIRSFLRISSMATPNIFTRLERAMQIREFHVSIRATIRNIGINSVKKRVYADVITQDMPISILAGSHVGCESNGILGSGWECCNDQKTSFSNICILNVVVSLEQSFSWDPRTDNFLINRKILQEEIASDVSIVARNGAKINYHKNFLLAHSSVFEEKLSRGFDESQPNTIQLSDLNEESVRALLAYLYLKDCKEAGKNCEIAFELLQAGHNYHISSLESAMKDLLLSKPDNWFGGEMPLKLFLFSRRIEEGHELKEKALWLIKLNHPALQGLRSYRQFVIDNPDAIMEILDYFFTYLPATRHVYMPV